MQFKKSQYRPNIQFADFISLSGFAIITNGVDAEGKPYTDYHGRHMFSNPSIVLKLGHSLIKLALLKIGLGIRTHEKEQHKDAKAFLALHKEEFTHGLASAASSSQKQMGNTLLDFPDEDDLRKLKLYQESLAVTLTEKLVNNSDVTTWRELAEIILSRLLVFNAIRGSEVASY